MSETVIPRMAVETRELSKIYRGGWMGRQQTRALDGVTLSIPAGVCYGLLGRNGAGKTTLMRVLLGLLHPSMGSAQVLGMTFRTAQSERRAEVAYVPQTNQLAGEMTAEKYCDYFASMYPAWDAAYAESLLARFDLKMEKRIGQMSGGQARAVALSLALATRPRLLLLDEPAAGLDPIARRIFKEELIDLLATSPESTVVFSTHIVADLEQLAEEVGVLDRGRLVLSERVETLRESVIQLQIVCASAEAASLLKVPQAIRTTRSGRVVSAVVRSGTVDHVTALLMGQGLTVERIPLSLEEIFVELVGGLEVIRHTRGVAA